MVSFTSSIMSNDTVMTDLIIFENFNEERISVS